MKASLSLLLLTLSFEVHAEWIEFHTKDNGDVFFFDNARVEVDGTDVSVWTRVRYQRSVMAAYSYESLLRLDCVAHSESTLQSTYFTDRDWTVPAMATNTHAKPSIPIPEHSASEQLLSILCE